MFSTQTSDVFHKNLWCSPQKPLMFFTQTCNFLHTNLQFSLYINLWCSSHKIMIFSTQTSDFLSPNLRFSPHKPDVLHTNLWFSPHEPLIFSPQTYDFLHQFKHTLLFLLHLIPVKSPAEECKDCNSYTCQSNKRQGIRNKSLIIV